MHEIHERLWLGCLALLLLGCGTPERPAQEERKTSTTQFWSGTESEFVPPNSNVTPLGPVAAKATVPGVSLEEAKKRQPPPILTADNQRKAFAAAYEATQGCNLVLDYRILYRQYNDHSLEIEIEGTAAKMEVGKQELK